MSLATSLTSSPGRDSVARWLMIAVLLLAAALLLYNLATWPVIHIDETIFGNRAIALGNGDIRDLVALDMAHHTRAALLPHAIFLKLAGVGLWQLRLVSATFGLLTIAATFALGRMLFGVTAGLAAAFLVAVAHLAIAFGRIGIMNGQALALSVLAFALVWRAYRRPTVQRWALAGGAVGGGLYSYVGFAIVPLVVGILFAIAAIFNRTFMRRQWRGLAIAIAIFAVVVAPLAFVAATNPEAMGAGGGGVTIFGRPDAFYGTYGTADLGYVVAFQLIATLTLFTSGGDRSTQYGYKGLGLDPVTCTLAIAGLFIAFARLRHARYALLLLWFWGVIFFGGVLTESPPLATRLVMALPPLCLMAGSAAAEIIAVARRLLPLPLVAAAVAAIAIFCLLPNADVYFRAYSVADVYWGWVEPNLSIAHYVNSLPDGSRVYLLRTPGVYAHHQILRFITDGKDVQFIEVTDWQTNRHFLDAVKPPAAVIFDSETWYLLDTSRLPRDGTVHSFSGYTQYGAVEGELFRSYEVGVPQTHIGER